MEIIVIERLGITGKLINDCNMCVEPMWEVHVVIIFWRLGFIKLGKYFPTNLLAS
jgi:hypothetical protein